MVDTTTSEWLTVDFITSCLESDSENFPEVNVTNITVEPAVAAGNNYGSTMLRVRVHYNIPNRSSTESSTNLIVKAPLTANYLESLQDMYEKEPKYYNNFIQQTYKICKHNIVPKTFLSPIPRVVVMEDLKMSGYEMVDRKNLLDLQHAQAFIKASAKLQALSIAVHKTNPELIEDIGTFKPEMVEAWNKMNKTSMRKMLLCLVTLSENNPAFEKYLDILKQLSSGDKLWKLYNELETFKWPLQSFAQLDPWCTNMMFKYDRDRSIVGVKLLDFQTTRWTSPLFELFTFIWSSVHPDVRELELDSLHKLYCDSLNENLTELRCSERLSIEQLKSLSLKFSPLLLVAACSSMPFCLYEGVPDANDFVTGELEAQNVKESDMFKMYQGPRIGSLLIQTLKHLQDIGSLDYLRGILKEI